MNSLQHCQHVMLIYLIPDRSLLIHLAYVIHCTAPSATRLQHAAAIGIDLVAAFHKL